MESSAVSEMKRTSMQLTGLFARLQLKKISVEDASKEVMTITDSLDKCGHWYEAQTKQMLEDHKELRLKNQKLHQEIYGLKEQIVRLEQKIDKHDKAEIDIFEQKKKLEKKVKALEEEKKHLADKISAFEDEETLLLNASIASDQAASETLNASIASQQPAAQSASITPQQSDSQTNTNKTMEGTQKRVKKSDEME